MSDPNTYWADLPPDELAKRAMGKVRAWRKWFVHTGFAAKAKDGWMYANGWTRTGATSSRLQMGGERQQLVSTVVNGIRPLRQRTAAMVLSGAPEMQPIATNSDAAAREQADLSKGVLEHIHRVHKRKKRDRSVLNLAMDMGEGALVIEWDARLGKPIAPDPETGEPALWEGDLVYWLASAFDLYRDPGSRDWDSCDWVIARRWVSRWRLAAVHPEKAKEILSVDTGRSLSDAEYDGFDLRMTHGTLSETDMVPVYTLWHRDTPELEGGLEFRFLDNGAWLSHGPYPYEGDMLPPRRLAPDDVEGTSLGYSNIFDALGLSDALNAIASAMVTNVTKGAVPPLLNPKGSGLSKGTPLSTGHVVLDVTSKDLAPFYMEQPQTLPEAYKLQETLERWRLEGMGLNETSMGRPPFSGMAAQAMALLDAKADEYQDSLREAFRTYLEECATFELRVLKVYAQEERIAQVAGEAKQWMTKGYSAASLSLVDGVHMEPVGPASRSQAARFGMLETLGNFGVPLKPEQVMELAQTGQYESDFEAPLANRLRIREENEMLMEGQLPPVIIARTHWLDIPEHLALLNSPNIVERPDVVQAVLTTVEAKLEAWRTMPSDILVLLGGPPPPPPGMPAWMMSAPPAGTGPDAAIEPGAPAPSPGGEMPPDAAGGAIEALDPNAEAPEMPQSPPVAA